MSAIVVLKEHDIVVLGSDSRYVSPDKGCIVSDSVEKINEICPDTFLATSGYAPVCNFQNARACELSQSTQDIQTLAEMLAEASRPIMEEIAAALARNIDLHPSIASVIAGDTILHGAVLIGRSRGEMGYILMESRCAGGRVITQTQEYFGVPRQISITSATDTGSLARLRHDWRLWTDPPISVVNAVLDAEKEASNLVGGQNQIVKIDSAGSRWISRLPAAIRQAECPKGIGTITAAVTMTSPSLVITGSNFVLNIDSVNTFLMKASVGTYAGATFHVDPTAMQLVIEWDQSTSAHYVSSVSPGGLAAGFTNPLNPASNSQILISTGYGAGSAIIFFEGAGPTIIGEINAVAGVFSFTNLPSSSPGAGSKQFFYDPATGIVHFAY